MSWNIVRGRPSHWAGLALFTFVLLTGAAGAQETGEATDDPTLTDPDAALVEVSLGDWDVKTTLADHLSRKVSEIPLTVMVSQDIASEVCPQDPSDLQQQVVVSPSRTCAAKKATSALEEEVRRAIGQ
ncbi:hypothetical protein [Jiella marina]|uniref:hypothetical protein n=1 Tax=Jiella sp. LLJ827 TaxID=2917712 RepID=UPI00210179CF|nr:hypothetical protein [Jiella sp. LLJ827]MCQ0989422.1 hypothetical protein [Jiella sp. LLJ827]